MTDAILKCTTRHIRIFTARTENSDLVADEKYLTLDLDPDNEFIWNQEVVDKINQRFSTLVTSYSGKDLTDYNLRKIGSSLEGLIRQLLQSGQLKYNPDCRVLNFSMGLPRTKDLL
ncbi:MULTISPECIES: NAD(P)H-quinone oxidoreductase subunit M [Prochlorococcus]|uniref:NAD(P)H-quinone oxidoreductase subunit M n=1 Tax=Prochlorococcus TaxID=1218 RepID=UPI0005338F0C|nr:MULTISPECIES: NAD(P)H-quinone oxidoreductase subunit M [Prochlorococcus]KGG13230.1 putative subunit of NAD(P)H:quinone oxidoreductase [Prochlorococcus sp. MIT 0601]